MQAMTYEENILRLISLKELGPSIDQTLAIFQHQTNSPNSAQKLKISPLKIKKSFTYSKLPISPHQKGPIHELSSLNSEERTKKNVRQNYNDKVNMQSHISIQKKRKSQYMKIRQKLNNLDIKLANMKSRLHNNKEKIIIADQNNKKMKKKKQHCKKQSESEKNRQNEEKDGNCNEEYKNQQKNKNQLKEKESLNRKTTLQKYVCQSPEKPGLTNAIKSPYSPKSQKYYVSEVVKGYKQLKSKVREHLKTAVLTLQYFKELQVPKKPMNRINLVRKAGTEGKKTVVLDLDETLMHCLGSEVSGGDANLKVIFPHKKPVNICINIRPYALQLLQTLSQHFEVIVFTASHSCYADVVMNHLDPEAKYIHHRLYREHCYNIGKANVKDLRIINRDLSQTVLIDNATYSFLFQMDNGIPIIPYHRGTSDFSLKALESYLLSLKDVRDVRLRNRQMFKLHRYSQFKDNLEDLVEQLYL